MTAHEPRSIAMSDCPEVPIDDEMRMPSLPWLEYVLRVTGGSRGEGAMATRTFKHWLTFEPGWLVWLAGVCRCCFQRLRACFNFLAARRLCVSGRLSAAGCCLASSGALVAHCPQVSRPEPSTAMYRAIRANKPHEFEFFWSTRKSNFN